MTGMMILRFTLTVTLSMLAAGALAVAISLGVGGARPSEQIAFDSIAGRGSDLYLADVWHGNRIAITRTTGAQEISPAWSPDGQHLAYISMANSNSMNLIVADWDGRNPRIIAPLYTVNYGSTLMDWSPDGGHIAIAAQNSGGQQAVYAYDVGTGQRQQIVPRVGNLYSPTYSPGGRLAFSFSPVANSEIYVFDPQIMGALDSHTTLPAPARITESYYTDTSPDWSPDGQWITFVSDRTGSSEIYVMRPDGTGLRAVTDAPSIEASPSWAPDSERIVFVSNRSDGRKMFVVDIGSGETIPLSIASGDIDDQRPAWRPH
jgi:TolB protein